MGNTARTLEIGQYSGTKIKEAVQTGFTCSVTTYYSETFDHTRHYHPNTHLSFVLKGGCEEQKKNRYHRNPLSTTFYYPGEEHQINHMANKSIHVNIEFDDNFFSGTISENSIASACDSNLSLPFLMIKIYKELQGESNFSSIGIESAVLSIFDTQQRVLDLKNIPIWLTIVKDYIWEHWNTNFSLDDLALICGVHKITISKYFPKYIGCTISDYQKQIRLSKAIEMMKTNKLCLTEIALFCGFSDQSHFIRFFKQNVGFLPKRFQLLQR